MTSAQIVEFAGVAIALVGSVLIPVGINKRKANRTEMESVAADIGTAAKLFKERADALQVRLDKVTDDYEHKIADLKIESRKALAEAEAGWRHTHELDQAQITQLRTEIDGLYRRLYEARPPS